MLLYRVALIFFIVNFCRVAGYNQVPKISFDYLDRVDLEIDFPLFALCEDSQGRIWFGSVGGGVGIYDGYSTTYLRNITNQDSSLISNFVLNIYKDHLDRMWIGTYHGFTVYDAEGNWLRNEMPIPETRKDFANYCESFLMIGDDIWIGTQRGLFKYSFLSREMEEFHCPRPPGLSIDVNDDFYIRLLPNLQNSDRIWLGSNNGLKSFNTKTHEFTRFEDPTIRASKIREGFKYATFDLKSSSDGKLSIAAFPTSGYLVYNPKTSQWQQYLIDKELNRNYGLYCVLPVSDSLKFYGTASKFGYVDLESEALAELSHFNGGQMGLIREMILSESGIIWMACEKGLVRTREAILQMGKTIRSPQIKRIELNGNAIAIKDQIYFDHSVHDINFEMVLVNPVNPRNVHFRWKLSDLDLDWKGGTSHNQARYTNLKGGKYNFEFQSKNNSGEWISGEKISFEVKKKWKEYIFFYPSLVIMAGAIIALIFGFINKNRRKTAEVKLSYERKVVEAELNALRSQMNPHFIFNSLNSIYSYIHNDQSEYAAEYLAKFSKLMRMVLQNSREKLVLLEDEIQVLKLYLELEQIRFESKFTWAFELNVDHKIRNIQIPPMLVQPYVENAIWHGIMHKKTSGVVTIRISDTESQRIKICIQDNGIGREQSKSIYKNRVKKSFGMEITKKRIDSFEIIYEASASVNIEDLADEDGKATGTAVHIDLPLIIDNKKSTTKP